MPQQYILPKIEKAIPIPKMNGSSTDKWKSFLLRMESGDSFRVHTERERCAVLRSATWNGVSVTTRKINGEGFRVWRVK